MLSCHDAKLSCHLCAVQYKNSLICRAKVSTVHYYRILKQGAGKLRFDFDSTAVRPELVMGWVQPWVGLGWVRDFFLVGPVGLGGDLTA